MTLTVLADHDGSQQQHPRKRTPTQLMLTYGDESTLLIILKASIWCPSNARTQSTLLVPTVSRASSQPAEQKHHYSICTCRMPNSTLRNQTLRLETCHRKQIDPSLQCQPGSPPLSVTQPAPNSPANVETCTLHLLLWKPGRAGSLQAASPAAAFKSHSTKAPTAGMPEKRKALTGVFCMQ
jgi:hypothetical protein